MLHDEIRQWWIHKVMGPLERVLMRSGIHPNSITLCAFALCFPCLLLYAYGSLLTAGWLTLLIGSLDILDGRVARETHRVTKQGEFLDSVMDRYQDFLLLSGVCYYYRNEWILILGIATIGGSFFVSYVRSKAYNIGVDVARVGVMQRPERFFLLGFGAIVSSVLQISMTPFYYEKGKIPPQWIFIVVLGVLAMTTNVSAFARIRYVWNSLKEKS
jgi:archaetidylinositol phosphate synthase